MEGHARFPLEIGGRWRFVENIEALNSEIGYPGFGVDEKVELDEASGAGWQVKIVGFFGGVVRSSDGCCELTFQGGRGSVVFFRSSRRCSWRSVEISARCTHSFLPFQRARDRSACNDVMT